MGYNLHITRASSWLESQENPILPEEWAAIVDADPALVTSYQDYYQRERPDGQIETIYPVLWKEEDEIVYGMLMALSSVRIHLRPGS